jgi:hypothetical protein
MIWSQYHGSSSLPTSYTLVSQLQHLGNERSTINETRAKSEQNYDSEDVVRQPNEVSTTCFRRLSSTYSLERPLSLLLEQDISYNGNTEPTYPDEQTPLLPLVPRTDERNDHDRPTLWNEFCTLFRYTLPVFG